MTTQENLNSLVTRKIEQKINKGTENATQAFERLYREKKMAMDFIAPLGSRIRNRERDLPIVFEGNGKLNMILPKDIVEGARHEIPDRFQVHQNAVGQIAGKFNIPTKYINSLMGEPWGNMLVSTILNTHAAHANQDRVLVRAVGEEVRGILSDHYRRLDGEALIRTFLGEVNRLGGVLADGYMTDTKIWVEAFLPEPIVIPTPKNGDVFIAFGARYSTSDYGNGASELRSFMMQGVCMNGMVSNSVLKAIHLGGRLEENMAFSERTYRKDTELQCSKIKDLTKLVFNPEFIKQKADKIQKASSIEVDLTKELSNLNKSLLTKGETDEVLQIITNNRVEDGVAGENTVFKMAQALAAIARGKDPERKAEIEEFAGVYMENC